MKSSRLEVRVISAEEESPTPYKDFKCDVNTLCVLFFSCDSTVQFWALAASMKLSVSFQLLSWTVSRTPWTVDQLTAPGDCDGDGEVGGIERFWRGKPNYSKKSCSSATLSATNPTWPDPGANLGRRGGKPATNRYSYGAAFYVCYSAVSLGMCNPTANKSNHPNYNPA
jgi:hypothetical protein